MSYKTCSRYPNAPINTIKNEVRKCLKLLKLHVIFLIAENVQYIFCAKVTVKPVLSGHSKVDKAKVLKANGSLMKVESIAECSHSVIFLTCIKR